LRGKQDCNSTYARGVAPDREQPAPSAGVSRKAREADTFSTPYTLTLDISLDSFSRASSTRKVEQVFFSFLYYIFAAYIYNRKLP
jgi:hypothetical protein